MTPEYSPFTPGQPVPVEFFVGRISEIERLRGMVRAAGHGRFRIGFVSGERGIGKSSLVSFVRHLGEREDSIAGTHVFLGGVTSLTEMTRRAFDRLLKESIEKPWHEKVSGYFGKHIRKVGLFGASVELSVNADELDALARDFIPSLRRLLSQLKEDRKALLLMLDDINGLAESSEFAHWLKSSVDQIATSGEPLPLCVLVVGIEERRQSLIRLQPSLARVFDVIDIRPWSGEETANFYRQSFEKNSSLKINEDALQTMVKFTGGLPVIAHEIGDAVWRIADESAVTNEKAMLGILNAAEIIGRKYLEPQIFNAIRSTRYRSILRKMVDNPFAFTFQRGEIRKKLTSEEAKVLDNFLNRMKDLGAILADAESGPGSYRFANQLHQLYFWLESERAKKES
jgi:AAA+ ATPase superfamily predicted ATPase